MTAQKSPFPFYLHHVSPFLSRAQKKRGEKKKRKSALDSSSSSLFSSSSSSSSSHPHYPPQQLLDKERGVFHPAPKARYAFLVQITVVLAHFFLRKTIKFVVWKNSPNGVLPLQASEGEEGSFPFLLLPFSSSFAAISDRRKREREITSPSSSFRHRITRAFPPHPPTL